VTGVAGRLAGAELGQAERHGGEPEANGRAAGTAGVCQVPPTRELDDGEELGMSGPDRPEPEEIFAAEDAAASAWANGHAEWPPLDPQARRGLHNLLSEMAEELGWRPDEMVQVRAGDLDKALLVAVCGLYEADRRMEAAAQQPVPQGDPHGGQRPCPGADQGRGMRWLEPGPVGVTGTRAERGDFEAG
jgi:hypothetical protein